MIPSHVPLELQNLTQIEEMLIACALPIMRVYIKPGGQRGYSGHCINLPQGCQFFKKFPTEPLIFLQSHSYFYGASYISMKHTYFNEAT